MFDGSKIKLHALHLKNAQWRKCLLFTTSSRLGSTLLPNTQRFVFSLLSDIPFVLMRFSLSPQHSGLFLSCALLRAILTNHVAHSEASKAAKTLENNLRAKLDEIDNENSKLDAELRR